MGDGALVRLDTPSASACYAVIETKGRVCPVGVIAKQTHRKTDSTGIPLASKKEWFSIELPYRTRAMIGQRILRKSEQFVPRMHRIINNAVTCLLAIPDICEFFVQLYRTLTVMQLLAV